METFWKYHYMTYISQGEIECVYIEMNYRQKQTNFTQASQTRVPTETNISVSCGHRFHLH